MIGNNIELQTTDALGGPLHILPIVLLHAQQKLRLILLLQLFALRVVTYL